MEQGEAINQVMARYNIETANNALYSYSELSPAGLNKDFIAQLLTLFEDQKNFSSGAFDCFSLDVIVDYIRRTHKYYLAKKLLEIEQSIYLLLQDYADKHPLLFVLNKFYSGYKMNLSEHIHEEESVLLPYINYLQNAGNTGFDLYDLWSRTAKYTLKSFTEEHHDTEMDLQEVRNSILEYKPPATNQTPYRILLSQLESFEKDLAVHALIEDKVLIPRALALEQKLFSVFSERAGLN